MTTMNRFSVCILLPLLLILSLALPARASWSWCKSDPVVMLHGRIVDIQVDIPLEYVPLVNGPTSFEIQRPKSIESAVLVSDLGYMGHGSKVHFTDGAGVMKENQFPTKIQVKVPIDKSRLADGEVVPAKVTVITDNAGPVVVEGTSDLTSARITITAR